MRIVAVALGLLLVAAAPAAQERLIAPPVPGFVVGYSAATDAQSIREEVPEGETVEAWSRMITTQRMTNLAERVTPAQFLGIVADALPKGCPGGKTTPIAILTVSGRNAAKVRADCPLLSATGKPETFFMLAVAGTRDMHIKQIAFRRVPTAADQAYATKFLAGVKLCGTGSSTAGC